MREGLREWTSPTLTCSRKSQNSGGRSLTDDDAQARQVCIG